MKPENKFHSIAITHDWLTGMRGGEYVLEALLELFPNAEIYTLVHVKGSVSSKIESHKIHTSFLQNIPGIQKYYRHFLPFMPLAISLFSMKKYDLILSSSHCVAKGIKKNPSAFHISYVHAPMRYMWDRFEDYFSLKKVSRPIRFLALCLRPFLQRWDQKTSAPNRVNYFFANSTYIQSEISKYYNRTSTVLHPFVDFERFQLKKDKKDFYLMVGAFAPNKNVEDAILACNELSRPLKIIGSGQEEKKLRSIAGPTIEFLGVKSNDEIAQYFSQARAFLFPGKEDFGITPLEALASGTPVIAYKDGGVLDTLTLKTAHFFTTQSKEALIQALLDFENKSESTFKEAELRAHAQRFSKDVFKRTFQEKIKSLSFS